MDQSKSDYMISIYEDVSEYVVVYEEKKKVIEAIGMNRIPSPKKGQA
jgi:hypothetical protein